MRAFRGAAGPPGSWGEGSGKVASSHRPAGSQEHPEAAATWPAPRGRGTQWLVRVSAAQGGAVSLRCGPGHREISQNTKTQQKPARAAAQIHSKRGGGERRKASVLPPLTTSVARDRSRVNEMLLQNSLSINAQGRGALRGRLQTNGKGRGLRGALPGGGRQPRQRSLRFLL